MCGGLRIATQVLDERYAPFIDLFAELDPAEQTRVVGDMLRRKNKKALLQSLLIDRSVVY